ncbi:MAG: nucleotidyl transferase AbiEii/AbiGii toxin family protein [Bacteroidota bacterium]
MRFEIASSDITFNGSGIKPFFAHLNEVCTKFGTSYFVVGAFARDLLLENIYNQPTGVATRDIDIAITIESWQNYQEVIHFLLQKKGFRKGQNVHEYISPENIQTDIIPYGSIEENRTVSFPPNFDTVMNMLGFQEVYKATIQIILDDAVSFKIASIEGIALLKFIAWADRIPDRISQKHVTDISLIIKAYFDAKVAEFATELPYLFDEEHFDTFICSARVLGHRFQQISKKSVQLKIELNAIFDKILKEKSNSLFLTQLTLSSNWDYAFCLRLMESLVESFRENYLPK